MFSNFIMFTIQKFDEMHITRDKYFYSITSLKNTNHYSKIQLDNDKQG